MTQELWSAVDSYYENLFVQSDPRFERILKRSTDSGLPSIQVSPNQGKFLELLVRLQKAERILEIGTLGGYSTAWLAQGMPPGGQLVTLEIDPTYAAVAKENLSQFEFFDSIEIRVDDAVESLQSLSESQAAPFDFIFIDADKTQYCEYLDWSIQLSQAGSMIVADNIVREGKVIDEDCEDPKVKGVRAFNQKVSKISTLHSTALQTVGVKGYDGFSVIYVA